MSRPHHCRPTSSTASHTSRLFYPALMPTQPCWPAEADLVPRCEALVCKQWVGDAATPADVAGSANRSFALSTDGLSPHRRAEFVLSQPPVSQRGAQASSRWVEVVRRTTDLHRDGQGRWLFPEGAASYGCWFLRAVGSGVFVHTGARTLVYPSTARALQAGLGHTEDRHPLDL